MERLRPDAALCGCGDAAEVIAALMGWRSSLSCGDQLRERGNVAIDALGRWLLEKVEEAYERKPDATEYNATANIEKVDRYTVSFPVSAKCKADAEEIAKMKALDEYGDAVAEVTVSECPKGKSQCR